MRTNTAKRRPLPWQKDPERLDSPTVQYWREGTMRTAMMPLTAAKEAVAAGTAFVITGQAIGALNNGCYND